MQLGLIGQTLRPLTIAAGLVMAGPSSYADIDQYSEITSVLTSHRTAKYINLIDNKEDAYQRMKTRFAVLYSSWVEKTAFLSSAKAIIEQEDFKAIVAMGYDAVPFIVNAIDERPSHLVWALNFIFNAKISNNPNTTISQACKLWVKKLR